jgi:hypothetical protein
MNPIFGFRTEGAVEQSPGWKPWAAVSMPVGCRLDQQNAGASGYGLRPAMRSEKISTSA